MKRYLSSLTVQSESVIVAVAREGCETDWLPHSKCAQHVTNPKMVISTLLYLAGVWTSTTIIKVEAEGGRRGLAVAGFGPLAVEVSLGVEESGVVIAGWRAAVNRAAGMWPRSWRGRGTLG